MKRLSLLSVVGLLASLLAGCPIYDNEHNGSFCGPDGCGASGGSDGSCVQPSDCGLNETCGTDDKCHTGDCTLWGCTTGFECVVDPSTHTASCQPGNGGTGGAGQGGAGQGGAGQGGSGGGAVYCGNPKDCAAGETCAPDGTCKPGDCNVNGCIFGYTCSPDGTCVHENPAACGTDADCAPLGNGYSCVSGVCTQPADQCYDQTQCTSGDKCADGKCTPACTKDADCPTSYKCDTGLGICSKPTQGCTITNDCGGPSKVCVDGACVPRSSGGVCGQGEVWVENGCIPNQSASFICSVDGQPGDGQPGKCASGSICLHHSCYISCEADASVCANLSSFNVCKDVTTSSGAHKVCGSSQNLGDQCDPTDPAKSCPAGKICLDGFCK